MRTLTFMFLLLAPALTAQVRFVPNEGQWPEHVQHRTEVVSGGIQIDSDGWTCWQWAPSSTPDHHSGSKRGVLWQAKWLGAASSERSDWDKSETDPDALHFYLGDNPQQWAEHVQASRRIERRDLWEGIDLRWRGTRSGNAKFEFTVAPGVDPSAVGWTYAGVAPQINPDGSLNLVHPLHNEGTDFYAQLAPPFAYQLRGDGTMLTVECHYRIDGQTVSLDVGSYDPHLPLVLDPEITFSTYAGSTGDNFGTTASNGPNGALIGGAVAFAPGYPTTPDAVQTVMGVFEDGISHVAMTVFNEDGSGLLYSTYLGGGQADIPHSLAFNESWGRMVLFGTTGSSNFPTTAGVHQPNLAAGPATDVTVYGVDSQPNGVDGYIASFNATDFTLEASTYFGGTGIDGLNEAPGLRANFGDNYRGQIDIGPDGSVWIATTTTSPDIDLPGSPPHAGGFDALVAGFDQDLTTLLCGRTFGGSGNDAAYSVEVAPDNSFGAFGALEVLVGGGTTSNDLPLPGGSIQPAPAGSVDGWIAQMNAGPDDLTVQFATYHGLDDYDQVYFVQRDLSGRPYAFGQARGGMPAIGDVYANPNSGQYIACFLPDLSDIEWQTTIGTGSNAIDISPTAFLVSECEQVYISGWGGQSNANSGTADVAGSTTFGLPITDSPFQNNTDGSDFYLAVLAPDATDLVYATFFGGPFSNEHVDGGSSRFDQNGTVYQSVCAGCGGMNDFPSSNNAWSSNNPSPNCNMGVFKFELGKLNANIDIDGPDQFCQGENVQFENNTNGTAAFTWDFGDANFSNEVAPEHLYGIAGTFEVEVIAEDTTGCLESDTAYVSVTIALAAEPVIQPVDPLCLGESVSLTGSGNGTLIWGASNSLSDTDTDSPLAEPNVTTTYTLTDATNCGNETAEITVEVVDMATTPSGDTQICLGDGTPLSVTSPVANAPNWTYDWMPPDGLSDPDAPDPVASPTASTNYTVTVTTPEGCERIHNINVDVVPGIPGDNVYPNVPLCIGQSVALSADDGNTWVWSPTVGLNNPASQTPTATPTNTTTYTVAISNLCGTGTDEVTVELIVPEAFAEPGGTVCAGEAFPVAASGGVAYQWVPGSLVTNPGISQTTVATATNQTFTVYVTDSDGCVASAEVQVNVFPQPTVEAGPDQRQDWLEPTFLYGAVQGAAVDSLWWTPENPLSCSGCLIPEVLIQDDMDFTLHVIDDNGCRSADVVSVSFNYPLYVPSAFTPDGDGLNDGWRPEGHWLNGAGTYLLGLPDGSILPNYRVEVWSRWGECIWASIDPRAYWTGGVGGPGVSNKVSAVGDGLHLAQPDVYTWVVHFPTSKGVERRTGKVTLVR